MDGSPPKHRGSILYESGEGHGWCWVLFRRMGELFKGSERLFIGEIEHSLMCLDDLKIEGHHLIEEGLIGSKPRSVSVLVVQDCLMVVVAFAILAPFLSVERVLDGLCTDSTRCRGKIRTCPQ